MSVKGKRPGQIRGAHKGKVRQDKIGIGEVIKNAFKDRERRRRKGRFDESASPRRRALALNIRGRLTK